MLKPGGTITVIEGDHGSTYFHPDSAAAREAIACQVSLQRNAGGDALIGRQLFPLLTEAGYHDIAVSPRVVYVDGSRPELAEGFIRKTFTAMVDGIRQLRSPPGSAPPTASTPASPTCSEPPNLTVFSATRSSRAQQPADRCGNAQAESSPWVTCAAPPPACPFPFPRPFPFPLPRPFPCPSGWNGTVSAKARLAVARARRGEAGRLRRGRAVPVAGAGRGRQRRHRPGLERRTLLVVQRPVHLDELAVRQLPDDAGLVPVREEFLGVLALQAEADPLGEEVRRTAALGRPRSARSR